MLCRLCMVNNIICPVLWKHHVNLSLQSFQFVSLVDHQWLSANNVTYLISHIIYVEKATYRKFIF